MIDLITGLYRGACGPPSQADGFERKEHFTAGNNNFFGYILGDP